MATTTTWYIMLIYTAIWNSKGLEASDIPYSSYGRLNYELDPIRLPLYDSDYITLLLGNPGSLMNFRINYTSNYIEIHRDLKMESQTYEWYSPETKGSEVFYFGKYAIRLPFISTTQHLEFPLDLMGMGPYDGTLGLGPLSPLWKYWRCLTISSQDLILGSYDKYLQRDPDYLPPVFHLDQFSKGKYNATFSYDRIVETSGPTQIYRHSLNKNVQIDRSLTMSYFPSDLDPKLPGKNLILHSDIDCIEPYEQMGLRVKECTKEIEMHLEGTTLKFKNGKSFDCISQYTRDENKISIGNHLLKDYTMFIHWENSYFTLSRSPFEILGRTFNALVAIITMVSVSVWLLIMYTNKVSGRKLFVFILVLELLFYALITLLFLVNIFVHMWSRYASYFIKSPSWIILIYVVYTLSVSVFGITILLITQYRKTKKEGKTDLMKRFKSNLQDYQNLRITLFINCALSMLWFSVLPYQIGLFDAFYIVFFNIALCILSSIITIHSYIWRRNYYVFMIIQVVLHYIFLILFNFIPTINLYFYGNAVHYPFVVKLALSLYLTGLVVIFPTIMIASSIESKIHLNSNFSIIVSDYKKKKTLYGNEILI